MEGKYFTHIQVDGRELYWCRAHNQFCAYALSDGNCSNDKECEEDFEEEL